MAKRCSRCSETKPLDSFHRDKRASDGRETRCKVCIRAGARAWDRANPEKKVAQDRRYREKNREKVAAYHRAWRHKNPKKTAAEADRKRKRWPEKMRARWALQNAISRGRLVKPDTCEGCGDETESRFLHGHHPDYSKPLDVEWLCVVCHSEQPTEPMQENLHRGHGGNNERQR